MKPPREPLYLARQTYQRRRMMDAARLLPVLGFGLLIMPLLWAPRGAAAMGTAEAAIYLFAVWFGLITVAFVIARRLAAVTGDEEQAGDAGGQRDDAGGRDAG